ncbi:MAG: hypothetical protein EVB12_00935, partial [Winogradskyella sp.]
MKKITILLVVATLCFSCKDKSEYNREASKITDNNYLDELYAVMQGSYNSEIQSQVDSTYYNISLHMYSIWEGKGHYLYVEQALNSMQSKPYRQRIYKLNKL